MNVRPFSPLRVLHLAGSCVSDFYHQLSLLYAKEVFQPAGTTHSYAVVRPDGLWQLGTSLEAIGEPLSLQEAIARLPEVGVVVPHMFCVPGMTSYRAFFEDILGIPVVGSPSGCTSLAANKAQTRNVVEAAGVRVAKAQILRRGDVVTMQPPFIVKPNSEDNSLGLTLVRETEQIADALRVGFEYDKILLAEEFIPGRELRVAVIEREGKLQVPPAIEYLVSEAHPIRTVAEKYELGADGMPKKQPDKPVVQPLCPAQVTPALFEQLATAAKTAHVALGCRDYSLYDFRVRAETEEPYLLEAGLFWGFGKISMISRMLLADNQNAEEIAMELWQRAARRVSHFNRESLTLSV